MRRRRAAEGFARALNAWQVPHFHKVRYIFRDRRGVFARSGTEIVAGAAVCQARCRFREFLQRQAQILWKGPTLLSRGGSRKHVVAGAAPSQGQVWISWQAQLALVIAGFVVGAALS